MSAGHPHTAPIDALRYAEAVLRADGDPRALRVADGFAVYEQEAPLGVKLDDALGLSRRGGAGPWWVVEARERRNALLREHHRSFLHNLDLDEVVTEQMRLATRRKRARTPPADRAEELMDEVLRLDVKLPKRKQLLNILGNSIGV